MTVADIRRAGFVIAGCLVVLAAFSFYLFQQLQQQRQKLTQIEQQFNDIQQQNDRILAYMESYHGSDDARDAERERIKILLEDHEAKIFNIVKTINELH